MKDNRIHVVHVGKFYSPHKGGMETHLRDLCRHLVKTCDTTVLVANDGRRREDETIDGVKVQRLRTVMNIGAAPVCSGMARAIRAAKPDVLHLHFPNPTAILAYFASGYRGPTVVTYHSDIVRQKVAGRAFLPLLNRFLSRCDSIIVGSQNYVDSSPVLRRFKDRCRIIPFGIEGAKFKEVNKRAVEDIRGRFGPPLLVGMGRLIYYKGFEYLIRSMKHVDGHCLIIGDGPLRAQLVELARTEGVSEKVSLIGEVDDIVPYLHAADVFVLSSIARSEAFGLVQLEAMACGTPVVNTHLKSGVPFVSIDELTGLTVPPADSDALAGAINRLLGDDELRLTLGANGRRRVETEFSLESMVHRTIEVYGDALQSQVVAENFDDTRRPATQRA